MSDTESEDSGDDLASFQDSVRDHLRRGMKDRVVLDTSVPELRDMQQACGQKPESLNTMLSKELLLLAVHIDKENIKQHHDDPENKYYLNAFTKVMEKYSSVLVYFIRSKESQYDCLVGLQEAVFDKDDGKYIEPHIDKIITAWEIVLKEKTQLNEFYIQLRNKQVQHRHQGTEKAKETAETGTAIDTPTDDSPPENMTETGARGVQTKAGTGNVKPVDDSPLENLENVAGFIPPAPEKSKSKIANLNPDEFGCIPAVCSNVDGSLYISGIFTEFGGTLCFPLTTDYLEIPAGAVPVGALYKVCGRVYYAGGSLHDVPMDVEVDTFVTRICDYHVHGNHRFLLPVTITMHHHLSCRQSLDRVRVLFSEDDGAHTYKNALSTQPEYTGQSVDDLVPWTENDLRSIRVKTYHFTRFLGIGPYKWEDTQGSNLARLNVIGKLVSHSRDRFLVHLKLYMETNLHNMMFSERDFMTADQNRGFSLFLTEQFMLPEEFSAIDQLVMSLRFMFHEWVRAEVNFGDDPESKLLGVKEFARDCHSSVPPVCIAEYMLTSEQPEMFCQLELAVRQQPLPPEVTEPRYKDRDLASWNWRRMIVSWSFNAPPAPVAAALQPPPPPPPAAAQPPTDPQDQVKPLWQQVLNKHRASLVREIMPSRSTLLDDMISAGLLEDLDKETFYNTSNEIERRSTLISHIERRGEEGFRAFVPLLLNEFHHVAVLLCNEMWLGWMNEDLQVAPSASSLRLSQIRYHFKRKELKYFSRSITTDFDDITLLGRVYEVVKDCDHQQLDGDDFLCTNIVLRHNPSDDLVEKYDSGGSVVGARGWRVLTVENLFSLARDIGSGWMKIRARLLDIAAFKHIVTKYPTEDIRAQMALLFWRDSCHEQFADERSAILHLHSILRDCKLDDADVHLTTLEQEAALRTLRI